MKGDITVIAAPTTQASFKNCAPFTKCITQIDGTTIDDVEDLDLVMPMYNLKECSSNHSEATGVLWFYSKDEATNLNSNIENTYNFKSLRYKDKLLRNKFAQLTPNNANELLKKATTAVPKYLRQSNSKKTIKTYQNFLGKDQPVITTRIYVLLKITIALKFMFYINSDLLILAKKLETPG